MRSYLDRGARTWIGERESGCYFNMKYFKELVHKRDLEESERYLSGFTKLEDSEKSKNMFLRVEKTEVL